MLNEKVPQSGGISHRSMKIKFLLNIINRRIISCGCCSSYSFFISRLDSKTLLQRYNPLQGDAGEYLHKSANLFTGFVPASRDKYVSVAVKFVDIDSNSYTVRVIKRGTAEDP